MAKKPNLSQIENQVDNLELNELLQLQKKVASTIAKLELHFKDKLAEAESNLELIRKGGE